jgi:hypothetical protein
MYDASGSGWSSYKYDTKSQFKGSVTLTDGAGGTYATGQSCGNCDKLKCNYHYLISKRIKSWDDIKNSVGSIDTSFDFTVGATLTDFDPDEIRSFQIVSSSAAAGITTHPQYTRLNSAGRHVKLYFAKNNQTYSGDYHSFLNIWDSSGQNKIQDKWTQKGPEDCPCELLLTEEDIKNNNNKKTTNYPREITSWDEFNLSNSIAWYYLKNNHPEKSINIFIKLSDYLIGDNGEVGDYYHMTKINLGHAYLLSGDLLKAQDIYKKYKLTGKFIYSWELTTGQTNDFYNKKSIKEFYLEDWTGFYNDGVLSKNNFILIKKELNIK